jgi:hypothetical protein
VAVHWGLKEAQALKTLGIKKVPSPIDKDYDWPGIYSPMAHQRETASFLTLHPDRFVLMNKVQARLHLQYGRLTTY